MQTQWKFYFIFFVLVYVMSRVTALKQENEALGKKYMFKLMWLYAVHFSNSNSFITIDNNTI